MKKNENAGAPRYCEIRDMLLTDIRSHRLCANDKIPTEPELMEQFHVSRTTVRRAIQDLVDNGVLVRRQGIGTFVNEPHFTRNLLGCMSFTSDCIANGDIPKTTILSVKTTKATEKITKRLNLKEGSMVYQICRQRAVNDEPVMIEYNCVPERFDFVRNCAPEELQSLIRLFKEKTHIHSLKYDAELSVSYATKQEAKLLGIKEGSVIFVNESVMNDEDHYPVFTSKQIIAADKVKLNFSS